MLGRDEADAQLMSKFWRSIAYKDGGPAFHTTRLEDVEAQAYALLLAERSDVHVPPVVVAGSAGPGMALIATPAAGLLADVDPASVTDAMLDDLWQQVAALHAASPHGRLNVNHVIVDGGPDRSPASSSRRVPPPPAGAPPTSPSSWCTALLVGDDRAVAAARTGLGDDAIEEALPTCNPRHSAPTCARLADTARSGRRRWRRCAAAAKAVGTEEPPLQELHRVSGTNLMMAIGTLIAILALLSQVGDPQELWDTVTNAELFWLIVALVISLLTNFATCVALMGTVPINLPLVRTAELQLSMSFSNLAVPAIGGMAAQIRFLQKQGVDLASAVASGGLLINVGNIVAQVMLLGIALLLAGARQRRTDRHPEARDADPRRRGDRRDPHRARSRHPEAPQHGRAAHQGSRSDALGGDPLAPPRRPPARRQRHQRDHVRRGLHGLHLRIRGSISFWTLLSLNIIISTLASLVPIPGGNTAVSSVGMSGALRGRRVPTDIAVATVLTDQLVASFLPAVPGWWATNNLLHDDYL